MSIKKLQIFAFLIIFSIILSACGNIQTIEAQSESLDILSPTVQLEKEATLQPESTEEIPTETLVPTEIESTSETLTWENGIKQIFEEQCFQCHGTTPTNGLIVSSYTRVLQGGISGPIIIPGNPEDSHIFYKMKFGGSHPGYMTKDQLDLLWEWISNGALEN